MAELEPQNSRAAGHELSDLNPVNIAKFGVVLAVVVAAAVAGMYLLFNFFYFDVGRTRPPSSPLSYSRPPTPEPRLAVAPGQQLKALRAEEERALTGYEWLDRERGIVRIPIERAIELVAKRGLPTRAKKVDRAGGESGAPR